MHGRRLHDGTSAQDFLHFPGTVLLCYSGQHHGLLLRLHHACHLAESGSTARGRYRPASDSLCDVSHTAVGVRSERGAGPFFESKPIAEFAALRRQRAAKNDTQHEAQRHQDVNHRHGRVPCVFHAVLRREPHPHLLRLSVHVDRHLGSQQAGGDRSQRPQSRSLPHLLHTRRTCHIRPAVSVALLPAPSTRPRSSGVRRPAAAEPVSAAAQRQRQSDELD